MTVPTAKTEPTTRRPRQAKEAVLAAAVDVARAAVEDLVPAEMVGDHEGTRIEGDRLLTHVFATRQPGYRGWHWAVTLSRPPRGRTATVCEVALLPGDGALLAPQWVPWSERLSPGDVAGTDVLPYEAEDQRLVAGFADTGEDLDRREIEELGLGRVRVLSPEGFDRAAARWYEGDHGPHTPAAEAAQGQCSTCGFFMKLAGTPRMMFGVCANEWAQDDGRVVSVDHGCGSHSETDVDPRPPLWNPPSTVMDEGAVEEFVLPHQAAAHERLLAEQRAAAATESTAEAEVAAEVEATAEVEESAEVETPAEAEATAEVEAPTATEEPTEAPEPAEVEAPTLPLPPSFGARAER